MNEFRHCIDDRQGRATCKLDESRVFRSAGHNQLVTAGVDGTDVIDRFACRAFDWYLLQKKWEAAELFNAHLKREASAALLLARGKKSPVSPLMMRRARSRIPESSSGAQKANEMRSRSSVRLTRKAVVEIS